MVQKNKLYSLIRHGVRVSFASLLIFEILNYFNILNFKLDFTWIGLITTASAIWIGLEFVEWFFKKSCNGTLRPAIWFTVVFAVYFDAVGDILNFYSRFAWYDQAAHFVGSAAAGLAIFFILQSINYCKKFTTKDWVIYLLVFTLVVFLGVCYEIDEYIEDFFSGTHRLGDGPDTVNDLLLDALGGFLVILSLIIIGKIRNYRLGAPKT